VIKALVDIGCQSTHVGVDTQAVCSPGPNAHCVTVAVDAQKLPDGEDMGSVGKGDVGCQSTHVGVDTQAVCSPGPTAHCVTVAVDAQKLPDGEDVLSFGNGADDNVDVVGLGGGKLTEHKMPGPQVEGTESGGRLEVGDVLGSGGSDAGILDEVAGMVDVNNVVGGGDCWLTVQSGISRSSMDLLFGIWF